MLDPLSTQCGTLVPDNAVLTTTDAVRLGNNSTIGFCQTWPYTPYVQPYTTYWATDPRVTALQAKVETLEKMLAAVLSGRDIPKARKSTRKGGGNC